MGFLPGLNWFMHTVYWVNIQYMLGIVMNGWMDDSKSCISEDWHFQIADGTWDLITNLIGDYLQDG